MNEGDEEGGQVSSKRVVILAAPADMNYDLGTKVSYKKYLKLARKTGQISFFSVVEFQQPEI